MTWLRLLRIGHKLLRVLGPPGTELFEVLLDEAEEDLQRRLALQTFVRASTKGAGKPGHEAAYLAGPRKS